MMTVALIVLGTLLAMCLIRSPSKTIFRVLWTLIVLPVLMGYALRLRKTEPSALADAWNEWRADFARGHL
jgi:hypothetical protein